MILPPRCVPFLDPFGPRMTWEYSRFGFMAVALLRNHVSINPAAALAYCSSPVILHARVL